MLRAVLAALLLASASALTSNSDVEWSINLDDRSYDPDVHQTTFTYTVAGNGAAEAVYDAIVHADPSCPSLEAPLTIETDPDSGVSGALVSGSSYTITVRGNVPAADQSQAVIRGSSSYKVVKVSAPNCDSRTERPTCSINLDNPYRQPCDSSGNVDLSFSTSVSAAQYEWSNDYAYGFSSSSSAGVTQLNVYNVCERDIRFTLKVTDVYGSESTCSETYKYLYLPDVKLSGNPASIVVESGDIPTAETLTASSACADVSVVFDETDTSLGETTYVKTRTWTATDTCGGNTFAQQEIRVEDKTPPTITGVPADTTVNCDAVPAPCEASAWDTNDGDVIVTFSELRADGSCPNEYALIRTWTSEDAAGNSNDAKQTITVIDITAPQLIGIPGDGTEECGLQTLPPIVTARDDCDSSVDVDMMERREGNLIVRTWTTTDSCGNEQTNQQSVTVEDTTPPRLVGAPGDQTLECDEDINIPCMVTGKDTCDELVSVEFNEESIAGGCEQNYQLVQTWTVTDEAGHSDSKTRTITVSDSEAPYMTTDSSVDLTLQCGTVIPDHAVTIEDNCVVGIELATSEERVVDVNENNFKIVRTYHADDGCGNTADHVQTITVDDTTPPTLYNLPAASVSVNCATVPERADVKVSDNCYCSDAPTDVSFQEVSVGGGCESTYTLIRTWSSTDCNGNTAYWEQSIHVVDIDAPTLSEVNDSTAECDAVPDADPVTADDTCDPAWSSTLADVQSVTTAGSCPDTYTLVRTYSATDACGNPANKTQTIEVSDNTSPTFAGVPEHTSASCEAVPSSADVTASDACADVSPTLDEQSIAGSCSTVYTLVRTWTVEDECGNSAEAKQTINVFDAASPVIDCTDIDTTHELFTELPAVPTYTATDACQGDVTVSYTSEDTGSGCNQVHKRFFNAVDDCGNNAVQCSHVYTISDTTDPTVTAPAGDTLSCDVEDMEAYARANYLDSAISDGNGVSVTVTCAVTSAGSCNHGKDYTCTYTAQDECGNTAQDTQVIEIRDNDAPQPNTVPEHASARCDEDEPAMPAITWTDNCELTSTDHTVTPLSTEGTETSKVVRVWSATDACGNANNVMQTVTINDPEAPVITCRSPDNIDCIADQASVNVDYISVTDNCHEDALTVTQTEEQGADGCNTVYTRTYTATDSVGNEHTCQTSFSIQDDSAPSCTLPTATTVECGSTVPIGDLSCTDNCDDAYTQVPTEREIDFELGTAGQSIKLLVQNWVAWDNCGNSQSYDHTVTVKDTSPPVFDSTPDATVNFDCSPEAAPTLTATDVCGSATVTYQESDQADCYPYTYTRTWTATDEVGNTEVFTQTVNVNGDPTLQFAVDQSWTESREYGADLPDFTTDTSAADTCGDFAAVCTVERVDGSCPEAYSLINTCTVSSDCAAADASFSQTVIVTDSTAPDFTVPDDTVISCDASRPELGTGCVDSENSCTTCGGCYEFTRTCTQTDDCGNSASKDQVFTVVDLSVPTVTVPEDVELDCLDAIPTDAATAVDNCGDANEVGTVVETTATTSEALRVTTRTWTFSDDCGLQTTKSQTVTFKDTTAPSVCKPWDDVTVEVGAGYNFPSEGQLASCECPSGDNAAPSDDCTAVPEVTCAYTTVEGSCPNDYYRIVDYTVTDAADLTAQSSYTVFIRDSTPPEFTNGGENIADITVQVDSIPAPFDLQATDAAGEVTVTFDETRVDGSSPNHFTLIRTWTATDACSLTVVDDQTVTVIDTVVPIITGVPAHTSITCDDDTAMPTETVLAAINHWADEDTDIDATTDYIPGTCDQSYKIVRTFTATDVGGNQATASYTVTVTDGEKPTWTSALPALQVVEGCDVPTPDELTAEDKCALKVEPYVDGAFFSTADVDVVRTVTENDVGTGGDKDVVYTWSAADDCGNSISHVQTVQLRDTTKPTFDNAPLTTLEHTVGESCEKPDEPTVTCTDTCGECTVTMKETAGDAGCARDSIVRTWTATDTRGNQQTTSQVITFVDDTPPTLAPVADTTGDLCQGLQPVALPVATDNCDDDVSVELTSTVATGVDGNDYIRTWTATDDCGRTDEVSQTIVMSDVTPPTITCPTDFEVACGEAISRDDATSSDDCGSEILSQTEEEVEHGCGSTYKIIRTFTADDNWTTPVSCTQTITIIDDGAPSFLDSTPADEIIQACEAPSAESRQVLECAAEQTVTPTSSTDGYVTIHTWSITDECGNKSEEYQTVTREDNEKPVITCDECAKYVTCAEAVPECTCSVTDNCDNDLTATPEETIVEACGSTKTIVRTWSASDTYGNAAEEVVQTVHVYDSAAPQFTPIVPTLVSGVECDENMDPPAVTSADDCDTDVSVTVTTESVSVEGVAYPYHVVHQWTTADSCGNTATMVQSVEVVDTTNPWFVQDPVDQTIGCHESLTLPTVVPADNCDVSLPGTISHSSSSILQAECPAITEYTWSVTDNAGLSHTAKHTVTITNDVGPVITVDTTPAVYECVAGAAPSATVVDGDGCDVVTLSQTAAQTALSPFPDSETKSYYTRTWSAEDSCGNDDSQVQTVTVKDTQDPDVSCTNCDDTEHTDSCFSVTTVTEPTVTSTDVCDGNLVPVRDDTVEGDVCDEAGKKYIYVYTATDAVGHSVTKSNTVTVKDQVAPSIRGVPVDRDLDCSEIPTFSWPTVEQDDCGEAAPVVSTVLTPEVVSTAGACANAYTLTATWTSRDACGNEDSQSASVTFTDITPPTLILDNSTATAECSSIPAAQSVTASDDCTAAADITISAVSEATIAGSCTSAYELVRTWTATDACGLTDTQSRTIAVSDSAAPTVDVPCDDAIVECPGDNTAYTVDACTPQASDLCDTATLTSGPDENTVAGASATDFTITRSWSFCDDCGNCQTTSQVITAQDTQDPTITGPAGVTAEYPNVPPMYLSQRSANDTCSDPTIDCTERTVDGSCPQTYDLVRTCTATDVSGNTDQHVQSVIVRDTTPPVIHNVPADATIEMGSLPPLDEAADHVQTTDNSGAEISLSVSEETIGDMYIRTFTAEDQCGNAHAEVQTLLVQDSSPPTFNRQPTDQTVECDAVPAACELTTVGETLTVDLTIDDSVAGMIIRTWTTTDDAGNTATHTQTITIVDNVAPMLSRHPTDETVECNCDTFPAAATLLALDNCDEDVQVDFTEQSTAGDSQDEYTLIRIWAATDDANNGVTHTQTITVEDNESPILYPQPVDEDAECDAVPVRAEVRALDNCDESAAATASTNRKEGRCAHVYEEIHSWTSTDRSGNRADHVQTVAVSDTVAPTLLQAGEPCVWPADETKTVSFALSTLFSTYDACAADVSLTFLSCNSTFAELEEGDCTINEAGDTVNARAAPGAAYQVWVEASDDCDNTVIEKSTIAVFADAIEHAASGLVCTAA